MSKNDKLKNEAKESGGGQPGRCGVAVRGHRKEANCTPYRVAETARLNVEEEKVQLGGEFSDSWRDAGHE